VSGTLAVPAANGGRALASGADHGAGFLRELDAGRIRAAWPDPTVAGGWRVDDTVRAGILELFGQRDLAAWEVGPFSFADRASLPLKRLHDSPDALAAADARTATSAGRPWRIVPGGTSIRAGAHLEPGVVVMPPSFVNLGAWVGAETMLDSHVLVGSCAQIGARVHLAAGVVIGGVLEPAGARPVIVEDEAFVGGGCGLYEGVLVGHGAVLAAGVVLTGTSRVYDLVRERVLIGTRDAPLSVPAMTVVVPGTRPASGAFAEGHGLGVTTALIVKDRDAGTDARVALEDALR
jgi:2,3,4,5-tetrahydropyridine-2,6-dicarboxylate N-succinyltransferase